MGNTVIKAPVNSHSSCECGARKRRQEIVCSSIKASATGKSVIHFCQVPYDFYEKSNLTGSYFDNDCIVYCHICLSVSTLYVVYFYTTHYKYCAHLEQGYPLRLNIVKSIPLVNNVYIGCKKILQFRL